jgi:hypothetical protein
MNIYGNKNVYVRTRETCLVLTSLDPLPIPCCNHQSVTAIIMTDYNTQNMSNEEPIVNITVTESPSFPILVIEIISPSLSLYSIPNSHLNDSTSLSNISGDNMGTGTRLTAELLGDNTPAAAFDMNGWGWSTETPIESIQMNHITPRQRTFSLCTVQSLPTPVPILRPIPPWVPAILPSLYASSHTGNDEDDATEADSIFFTNEIPEQEAQIRTTNSIPAIAAPGIITSEIGFNAPEAFTDFEDLGIIVAALRINADESEIPDEEMFDDGM